MLQHMAHTELPPIPAKRYFTIGEVGELCGVKPHVLRYWEQEFSQLRPMKRRGNRRYYQHNEVLMVRRIRQLLYEQGFTISGARNKLQEVRASEPVEGTTFVSVAPRDQSSPPMVFADLSTVVFEELKAIRRLLSDEDAPDTGI